MKTEPEEREVLAAAASRAAAMVLCALDALEKEARGREDLRQLKELTGVLKDLAAIRRDTGAPGEGAAATGVVFLPEVCGGKEE